MSKVVFHQFQYAFAVPLRANQTEFKLEQSSRIQDQRVTGVMLRFAGTNSKTKDGSPVVREDLLNAAFLTLKQRNTEIIEEIPMEVIAKITDQGLWYDLDIPMIDMAQSSILVSDTAELATSVGNGEQFELIFRYEKKVIKKG